MIKTESFLALFLVLYCPIATIAATLFFFYGSEQDLIPALWGSGVSIFLILFTVFFTDRLTDSSTAGLFLLVFGGLVFRFFVVLSSGLYVHFLTNMSMVSFFLGLLFSYILLQIIEVIYFQKRFGKRKADNK